MRSAIRSGSPYIDSGGTLKAHATATTTLNGTDGYFAYSDGFCVEKDDWSDSLLDIQPGDWAHFRANDGFTNSVQVGTITAQLTRAPTLSQARLQLRGSSYRCKDLLWQWGVFGRTFTVDPNGGAYFVDFSPDDLLPGMEIEVGYMEPDMDQVANVFRAPWQVYLPLILRD